MNKYPFVKSLLSLCVCLAAAYAGNRYLRPLIFYPKKVVAKETYVVQPAAPDHIDHAAFDALLKKYVVKGKVDYAGMKTEEAALRGYLKTLENLDSKRYSRDELLALFVNAYNAATLALILEYYPGISSIKDIPTAKRWDDKRWKFCGELVSLSDLEHNILRTRFQDPRVHFAINCGSNSCPPLRAEAYKGDSIDAQLKDQAVTMNQDYDGAKFDAGDGSLKLSKVYDWYEDDFAKNSNGSLKDFVLPYLSPEAIEALKKNPKADIKFQEYDWKLNDLKK